MANTVFKLKRSSVAGKWPNTSSLSIGELALNLTDRKLFFSDGANTYEIGANVSNVSTAELFASTIYANNAFLGPTIFSNGVLTVSNSSVSSISTFNASSFTVGGNFVANSTDLQTVGNITLATNNKKLNFKTVSGANVSFIQQSDDNFVLYSTNTTGGARSVFNVYANTDSNTQAGAFRFNTSVDLQSNPLYANGSLGVSGQALISNGSSVYWGNVQSSGSSSVDIRYVYQSETANGSTTNYVVNGGYDANTLNVYVNGVRISGAEVNVSSGSNVVFNSAPVNGSIIEFVGYITGSDRYYVKEIFS